VVTALLLLGLTAFDLGGDVFAYVACPLCTAQTESGSEPDEPHRDDCFCCSHCVRPSPSFELQPVQMPRLAEPWFRVDAPSVTPHKFFHPPRLG
jgi:hypothetical protein